MSNPATPEPASAEPVETPPAEASAEFVRTALAALAFCLLLCSYYVLRPVRDAMAVHVGSEQVPWLFTGTLVATLAVTPLFGWFVQRCPRGQVTPLVYGGMIACLAGFYAVFLFEVTLASAAAFFIWVGFFNLFVVSLFWSAVSDAFTTEQAQRRYSYIAAGGTAGGVIGPGLTATLAEQVSLSSLLLISMALLALAGVSITALRWQGAPAGTVSAAARPIGGSIFAGVTHTFQNPKLACIAGLAVCYSAVSTVLYQQVTDLVGKTYADAGQRTVYFAHIDLAVNLLTLVLQLLLTRTLLQTWGLRWVLSIVPAVVLVSLATVGVAPVAGAFAVAQVLHRAGEFALSKPGREILFTTVDAENRYKAKNFIDTAVYRINDTTSIWLALGVRSLGGNTIWIIAVPATLVWLALAQVVGRRYGQFAADAPAPAR